ncbi:hypothetical protein HPB47_020940, partial [Ixodes persulcatus]
MEEEDTMRKVDHIIDDVVDSADRILINLGDEDSERSKMIARNMLACQMTTWGASLSTLYVKVLLLLKSPAGTWLTWRFWFLHRRLETLSLAVLLGLLTN